MPERRDLEIRVRADATGLRKIGDEAQRTGDRIDRSNRRSTSSFTRLDRTIATTITRIGAFSVALGGIALAGLTVGAVRAASDVEQLSLRLEALTGSAEAAGQALDFITDLATSLPFTLQATTEAAVTLEAFGAEIEQTLPLVADLAAVMGLDIVEAANAFGRAFAGGAGAADIFRERGILQLIKDAEGIEDLTKLTLPEFRAAMIRTFTDAEGAIAGTSDKLSNTLQGAISNVQDSFLKFQLQLADAGVFERISEEVDELRDTLQRLEDDGTLQRVAEDFSDIIVFTIDVIKDFTGETADFISDIAAVVREVNRQIQPLKENINAIADALSRIGDIEFLGLGERLKTLGGNIKAILNPIGAARDGLDRIADNIRRNETLSPTGDSPLDFSLDANIGILNNLEPEKVEEVKEAVVELSEEAENLTKSLQRQNERLEEQIATFGKGARAAVQFAVDQARAAGVSEDVIRTFQRQSLALIELREAQEAANEATRLSEERAQEIESLNESVENQTKQLQLQLIELQLGERAFIDYLAVQKGLEGVTRDNVDAWRDARVALFNYREELERQDALERFTESLVDQQRELQKQIEATRIAAEENIELADALLIVEGRWKGIEDVVRLNVSATEALTSKLKEVQLQLTGTFDGLDESLEAAGEAALDLERMFLGDREEAGEDIGEFLAEGLVRSFQDTASGFLNSFLQGEFNSILDILQGGSSSIVSVFADTIGSVFAGALSKQLKGVFDNLASGDFGSLFRPIGGDSFLSRFSPANLTSGAVGVNSLLNGNIGQGIGGLLGAGVGLIPGIGPIVSGVSSIALPVIGGLIDRIFGGKDPRLDIDFREAIGGRVTVVEDFLDGVDDLIEFSSNRKVNADEGELTRLIGEAISGQILAIQNIINTLPSVFADRLNQSLLNSDVLGAFEIEDDRLLEFDEKTRIDEKLTEFLNGELQSRFIFSISDFFRRAFVQLGANTESALDFVSSQFSTFSELEGRENRAAFGQQFLETFQTFVQGFNIVNNQFQDESTTAVNSLNNLARSLGFDFVPSLERISTEISNALTDLNDVSRVQGLVELRNQIVSLTVSVSDSVSGLASAINSVNSDLIALGGSAIDISSSIRASIGSIQDILSSGGLSGLERQDLLGGLNNLTDQLQQAFLNQNRRNAEAQNRANQRRVDSLRQEITRIQESSRIRLDALNEELRLANQFKQLAESIQDDLDRLLFSPDSFLSPIEQIVALQSRVTSLQTGLAGETDPNRRIELINDLRDAFSNILQVTGDTFGVGSPEFISEFDRVTSELQALKDITEGSFRPVEDINAEILMVQKQTAAFIASINTRITSLNQSTQTQIGLTGAQIAEIRGLREQVAQGLNALLPARVASLGNITADVGRFLGSKIDLTNRLLGGIRTEASGGAFIRNPDTTTARSSGGAGIPFTIQGGQIVRAASGFEGRVNRPTLFIAGEGGIPEDVSIRRLGDRSPTNVNVSIPVTFNNATNPKEFEAVLKNMVRNGSLGKLIVDKVKSAGVM